MVLKPWISEPTSPDTAGSISEKEPLVFLVKSKEYTTKLQKVAKFSKIDWSPDQQYNIQFKILPKYLIPYINYPKRITRIDFQ